MKKVIEKSFLICYIITFTVIEGIIASEICLNHVILIFINFIIFLFKTADIFLINKLILINIHLLHNIQLALILTKYFF